MELTKGQKFVARLGLLAIGAGLGFLFGYKFAIGLGLVLYGCVLIAYVIKALEEK